jgi:hypothetical protein
MKKENSEWEKTSRPVTGWDRLSAKTGLSRVGTPEWKEENIVLPSRESAPEKSSGLSEKFNAGDKKTIDAPQKKRAVSKRTPQRQQEKATRDKALAEAADEKRREDEKNKLQKSYEDKTTKLEMDTAFRQRVWESIEKKSIGFLRALLPISGIVILASLTLAVLFYTVRQIKNTAKTPPETAQVQEPPPTPKEQAPIKWGEPESSRPDITDTRALTAGEVELAKIFGDEIKLDSVQLHAAPEYQRSSFIVHGSTLSYKDIVFYGEDNLSPDYSRDTVGFEVFFHEMTHIWQRQNKFKETRKSGNDSYSYKFNQLSKFTDFAAEQQACIIGDYARRFLAAAQMKSRSNEDIVKKKNRDSAESDALLIQIVEEHFPEATDLRLRAGYDTRKLQPRSGG